MKNVSIAFVDNMLDGKLSYILSLIEAFERDKENLPKDSYGNVKTVSLKAWLRKNDTKYDQPVISRDWNHGRYHLAGTGRFLQFGNTRDSYDTYDDLADEVFHRVLRKLEFEENKYFAEHDEYSVLKRKIRDYYYLYHTTFGLNLGICSNGSISVYQNDTFTNNREITIDEAKLLVAQYEKLRNYIAELSADTNITY